MQQTEVQGNTVAYYLSIRECEQTQSPEHQNIAHVPVFDLFWHPDVAQIVSCLTRKIKFDIQKSF